jgi:hypothetical protein
MMDEGVVVLGIPIPSSSPLFLSIIAVHVVAGIVCTLAGIVAMLAPKRDGRHPSAGTLYFRSLVVVSASMAALSVLRWPANTHLLVLGVVSFGAGLLGRTARRRRWPGWLSAHVAGMGVSYIVLLTAFYVDNGPHLPIWRSLPAWVHWLFPSIVGLPILIWALTRHRLMLHARAGSKRAT